MRHSLASFLVRKGTDVKTVQKMLRHSDVTTTLGIYAHSMSEDRLAAQDDMLAAMMTPSNAVNSQATDQKSQVTDHQPDYFLSARRRLERRRLGLCEPD